MAVGAVAILAALIITPGPGSVPPAETRTTGLEPQGGHSGGRSAPMEPGAPPAWGAGLAVSPFSTVNLMTGNLLTAIPIVSWDSVGPPVEFVLYHNS